MASILACPVVVLSTSFGALQRQRMRKCQPLSNPDFSLQFLPESVAAMSFGCQGLMRNNSCSIKRKQVVAAAGPPSSSTLAIAFVVPLSLILVTIITSIRIADKLDEQYLEELAINEAIMEEEDDAEEEEDDDAQEEEREGDALFTPDDEPALPMS